MMRRQLRLAVVSLTFLLGWTPGAAAQIVTPRLFHLGASAKTVRDLVSDESSVEWYNNSGERLEMPYSTRAPGGYYGIRRVDLEDGSVHRNVIRMRPPVEGDEPRYIEARWRVAVKANYAFAAIVGFVENEERGDTVQFMVLWQADERKPVVVAQLGKRYDGKPREIAAPLGQFAGQRGRLVLRVVGGKNPAQEHVTWINARLVELEKPVKPAVQPRIQPVPVKETPALSNGNKPQLPAGMPTLDQALRRPGGGTGMIDSGVMGSLAAKMEPLRLATPFEKLLMKYSNYDMDNCGPDEIRKLRLMSFENPLEKFSRNEPLVLVIVEPRLLLPLPGCKFSTADLVSRLARFRQDLRTEGWAVRVLTAEVYDGWSHQDGLTLLALRRFLRDLYKMRPNLGGVVLVGSFPEATLVRRWVWRKKAGEGFRIGAARLHRGDEYLYIRPELISERAELVLADLDGDWESLYRRWSQSLDGYDALPENWPADWPKRGRTYKTTKFNSDSKRFEDFFWIRDDNVQAARAKGTLSLRLLAPDLRNPEMCAADKTSRNPLAHPEICISRINARHIAVDPPGSIVGLDGKKFLDAKGRPQSVRSSVRLDMRIGHFWQQNPRLEREILIDYFDRNHNFRTRRYNSLPFRVAAIAYDDKGSFSAKSLANYLGKASRRFKPAVVQEKASLLDYAKWLKQPAVLRGITAHSGPQNSAFSNKYNLNMFEYETGPPWRWEVTTLHADSQGGRSMTYAPSYVNQKGAADLFVHRALWSNGKLAGTGASFYIHVGCKANSPSGGDRLPYTDPLYGAWQNAEGVLFYLNGLAVMSRAKVFYDWPKGFPDVLGANPKSPFGDGWKEYFREEALDLALSKRPADCKRCYTWSLIGDWTLRLRY